MFKEEKVKVNERKKEKVDVGNEVTERLEVKRVVVRKEDLEEEKVETHEFKKVVKIGAGGVQFEVCSQEAMTS